MCTREFICIEKLIEYFTSKCFLPQRAFSVHWTYWIRIEMNLLCKLCRPLPKIVAGSTGFFRRDSPKQIFIKIKKHQRHWTAQLHFYIGQWCSYDKTIFDFKALIQLKCSQANRFRPNLWIQTIFGSSFQLNVFGFECAQSG